MQSRFHRSLRRCGLPLGLALLAAILPAAAETLRPLCPDRPGKGTSPCTLDAGHFQLEVDGFDASFQRSEGVTSDLYVALSPTLKYGLNDVSDVEVSFAPLTAARTHAGGSDSTIAGNGDLYLRGKWNLLPQDGPFAAVLAPFVKVPTARRGLGDGALKEGLALPLAYDLGGGWSLSSTPEADLLLDASGRGRHVAAIDVIGLGRAFADGIALGAEIWTSQDFDPSGTASQYSFDLDAAWQPDDDKNLQWDAGVNLGLDRNTPGAQIYFGVSRRF
jgi:hypothetical protein